MPNDYKYRLNHTTPRVSRELVKEYFMARKDPENSMDLKETSNSQSPLGSKSPPPSLSS